MEYISVKEFADKFGISERTARNYCSSGKIENAQLIGRTKNGLQLATTNVSLTK